MTDNFELCCGSGWNGREKKQRNQRAQYQQIHKSGTSVRLSSDLRAIPSISRFKRDLKWVGLRETQDLTHPRCFWPKLLINCVSDSSRSKRDIHSIQCSRISFSSVLPAIRIRAILLRAGLEPFTRTQRKKALTS